MKNCSFQFLNIKTWTILSFLAGNEDKKFAILGSRLVIAESLDCETKEEYKLVIAATDGVKFSANVTVST